MREKLLQKLQLLRLQQEGGGCIQWVLRRGLQEFRQDGVAFMLLVRPTCGWGWTSKLLRGSRMLAYCVSCLA